MPLWRALNLALGCILPPENLTHDNLFPGQETEAVELGTHESRSTQIPRSAITTGCNPVATGKLKL